MLEDQDGFTRPTQIHSFISVCKLQIVETNSLAYCKLLLHRVDTHTHQGMKDC